MLLGVLCCDSDGVGCILVLFAFNCVVLVDFYLACPPGLRALQDLPPEKAEVGRVGDEEKARGLLGFPLRPPHFPASSTRVHVWE